jgi:TRAP-type uncharacterized transport system substrate-binding protein
LQGIASGTLQLPLNQALLKMEFMIKLFFIVVTLLLSISYANANSYIFIGAGPLTEEAYLVGGTISKTVNNKIRVFRLRASVESTQGDKETLRLLKSGDVELGVVHSKTHASKDHVRAVFSIPKTSVIIVTSDKTPDSVIYPFTKAIFENLNFFKIQLKSMNIIHPKPNESSVGGGLADDAVFTKGNMLTGFSYTIHPAASKYYKEKGIKPKRW